MKIIEKIFDKNLISDLRFIFKNGKTIVWSKRSKYKINLPMKINKNLAYLSGVIIGDGNITLTKRKTTKYPRLRLTIFNASKDYLKFLNSKFCNIFNISGIISKKKDKNCYTLIINKKLVILYFLKVIGISIGKKKELMVPIELKRKTLFKYFLAGLYDTDGFFSETFGIMMCGDNSNFLKGITDLSRKYYNLGNFI